VRFSEGGPAGAAGLFVVVDGISCQVMTLAVLSAGGLSTTTCSHINTMVSTRLCWQWYL